MSLERQMFQLCRVFFYVTYEIVGSKFIFLHIEIPISSLSLQQKNINCSHLSRDTMVSLWTIAHLAKINQPTWPYTPGGKDCVYVIASFP